jgi:hypothetical protein
MLESPGVHEAGIQQRAELLALLVGETCVATVGGRVYKVF